MIVVYYIAIRMHKESNIKVLILMTKGAKWRKMKSYLIKLNECLGTTADLVNTMLDSLENSINHGILTIISIYEYYNFIYTHFFASIWKIELVLYLLANSTLNIQDNNQV